MSSYLTIGIFLAIALSVVGLLAWEIIYTKGLWYVKIISTTAVMILIFFSIHTWQSIQGTPKYLKNAEGLIVRSYMIKEPKHNQKGKIWLWVTDPNRTQEPYNIEIPYTEDTHKKLMENQGLAQGRPQLIKRNNKNIPGTENDTYIFEDVIKFIPKDYD